MNNNSNSPPQAIHVAFWNLQNLFDIDSSSMAAEFEFTPVHGWTRRVLENRIASLADIIRSMNDGNAPDLLGLCEIETDRVTEKLIEAVGRSDYEFVRHNTPGMEGNDTALIYSSRLFEPVPDRTRSHIVHLDYPTRDVLEVEFRLKDSGTRLTVFVTHWPSRRTDGRASAALRTTVARHCRRLVDGHLKLSRREYLQLDDSAEAQEQIRQRWNRNVLFMGDFNDPPWQTSLTEDMQAVWSIDRLQQSVCGEAESLPSYRTYASTAAWLLNPTWSLLSVPDNGTTVDPTDDQSLLLADQMLISRGLFLGRQGLRPVCHKDGIPDVRIIRPPQMTQNGRPVAFSPNTHSGCSDHFPVTLCLQQTDDSCDTNSDAQNAENTD